MGGRLNICGTNDPNFIMVSIKGECYYAEKKIICGGFSIYISDGWGIKCLRGK